MRFIHSTTLLLAAAALFTTGRLAAQTPSTGSALAKDLAGQFAFVGGRFSQLLDAMPDKSLDYRPAKGVRSVREVYTHIGDANLMFLTFAGWKMPDMPGMSKDQSERENRFKTKADIAKALKASFDANMEYIAKMTEADFDKPVKMFGRETTVRNAMLTNLSHMHEHFGQAIAYARVNGVVPPWSRNEN